MYFIYIYCFYNVCLSVSLTQTHLKKKILIAYMYFIYIYCFYNVNYR